VKTFERSSGSSTAKFSPTTAEIVSSSSTSGYTKNDAAYTRYRIHNPSSAANSTQATKLTDSGKFVIGGCPVRAQMVPIQIVCMTQPTIMNSNPAYCRRFSRTNSDTNAARVPSA
jgi:hypothetical protein